VGWRCIAGGGATGVGAASPISIRVNDELGWSRLGNDESKVEGALKVPKDPFCSNKVSFPGVMHMQTDLLNSVGDVRPSEGEVLKCTSKTAISLGISNRSTCSCKPCFPGTFSLFKFLVNLCH
jgi:hypothetical protein